jgi:serine/threonine protein kinase
MGLERGTLINNRYRIVEILGQGGMGSVYRAIDENLGVEVAVKDNLFTTEEYARQFRREAIILANLRHPNLPRLTDHFVISGQGQYLVMDYIEGEDLRQRMERVGTISEEEAITIGAAVCDALSYLGSRKPPIIHRDLKPGNVKISPQGEIYLVDFGLAKAMHDTQATATGARAMTPGYSPPEQYGTARTDQRSDIYSLGATLYAALTNAVPEDGLARAMDQIEFTPLRKHNPHISRRLATVIEKALAIRPDDRYQTAEEFKQALLSASTVDRKKEGEYVVAPAPLEKEPDVAEDSTIQPDDVETLDAVEQAIPDGLSVDNKAADNIQPDARPRWHMGIGCWLASLLFIIIIASVGVGVYMYDPAIPRQALSQIWSGFSPPLPSPSSTSTLSVKSSPTQTKPAPVLSVPFTPTDTLAPTLTPTLTDTPVPTASPTSMPTPLGGASQIAFASDSTGIPQLYIINSDGSGRRQITEIPEGACQPDWSPDGRRLVFISPCSVSKDYYPTSSLFIVNTDGSGLLPLPRLSGGDYDPAWSPDGERIAFTSTRNSGRPQIYVIDLKDQSVTGLSDKYSYETQPSWFPDGRRILYVATRGSDQRIWTMDADGKNRQPFSFSQGFIDFKPELSPDGQTVLITQYVRIGGIPRVAIVPFNSDEYVEYRIGNGPLPMREAVFSPDGLWLAFEGWTGETGHDIYLITVTGAALTRLTTDPRWDFDASWGPPIH